MKITGRKKYYFDNPLSNLKDVFYLISREINSDAIFMGEGTMKIKKEKLIVEYCETVGSDHIIEEKLLVKQTWASDKTELFKLKNTYKNMSQYIAEEILSTISFFKSDEDLLSQINESQKEGNRSSFLNIESFVSNIHYEQLPDISMAYETSCISTGLQSMVSIKIPQHNSYLEKTLYHIRQHLVYDPDVDRELNLRYGRNQKNHLKMIREGKLKISKSSSFELENISIYACYSIADLCKYYVGIKP